VRRAALEPRAGSELYLNGRRMSITVALLGAAEGHTRLLEMLSLLLRAGAVPATAATAAVRSLASVLPPSGLLPKLLDAAATCAEELPAAASSAGVCRAPAAAAATVAWLLRRLGDAQAARRWRGTALKRFPGLARFPRLAHALSATAGAALPTNCTPQPHAPLPPSERAPAMAELLRGFSRGFDQQPNAVTAAQLAPLAACPPQLLDATCGLVQLALDGHAAQPGVCAAVASVLSHLLLLVGNASEDAWDAAADAVSRGITAALGGAAAEHADSARHASAALLSACLAEGVLCFEQAAVALLPLPLPSGDPAAAAAWVASASLLLGCTQRCALAAAQASVDTYVLLPMLEAAAEHAAVSQALRAVAGNVLLRRALLSNMRWDVTRPGGGRHTAHVLQVLRTGHWSGAAADTAVGAAADALLRTPATVALRLTLAEVRLRLGGDASGKSGAQAVLAALAAQPDAAPVLSACVAALGPTLSVELLQQSRTLLASQELLRGACCALHGWRGVCAIVPRLMPD
jgi:hypothetical protein